CCICRCSSGSLARRLSPCGTGCCCSPGRRSCSWPMRTARSWIAAASVGGCTPVSECVKRDERSRMKSIIVGCGRVGAGLARSFGQRGQVVIVVDQEATAFERLGPHFTGQTVLGAGLDRDVLLQAGIDRVDGLAAVTGSDDTNVVLARLARQVFQVPRV